MNASRSPVTPARDIVTNDSAMKLAAKGSRRTTANSAPQRRRPYASESHEHAKHRACVERDDGDGPTQHQQDEADGQREAASRAAGHVI